VKSTALNLKWVQRLFRELTGAEVQTLKAALGTVPWHEHDDEDLEDLWRAVERGEIGIFTARNPDTDTIALASFYAVKLQKDGSKNFHSIATVAMDPEFENWLPFGMQMMDKVALAYGCRSMSLHTIRPGLARALSEKFGWFPSEIVLRKILPDHGS
jgi:hypothetical protein